jgi:hypothetical protein
MGAGRNPETIDFELVNMGTARQQQFLSSGKKVKLLRKPWGFFF